MTLQKINHATDMIAMECLYNAVKGLSMRSRRIICSMLRNNANKNGLIAELGITLEQYCILVSLLDASFK